MYSLVDIQEIFSEGYLTVEKILNITSNGELYTAWLIGVGNSLVHLGISALSIISLVNNDFQAF